GPLGGGKGDAPAGAARGSVRTLGRAADDGRGGAGAAGRQRSAPAAAGSHRPNGGGPHPPVVLGSPPEGVELRFALTLSLIRNFLGLGAAGSPLCSDSAFCSRFPLLFGDRLCCSRRPRLAMRWPTSSAFPRGPRPGTSACCWKSRAS